MARARKPSAGLRRLWAVPVAIVLACICFLWADRDTGASSLLVLSHDVSAARDRVEQARAERESLVREIRQLRDDVFTIEDHARRELGMVRPGERVLRWPQKRP